MSLGQPIEIVDVTETPSSVRVVKPEGKIYIRSVRGAIEGFRRWFGFGFLVLFALLPWLQFEGRQAILFDFGAQRFHLFGLTLWPQDLTLLAWLFIVAAFALFVVTAVWGRVWCGFMCPQTVFTFLFVWVEEKVEGARNKRIQLDKQPASVSKVAKKVVKHSIWATIAGLTSITFVGYFTPIDSLFIDIATFEVAFWPAFYVLFFAVCTYLNAGWMREVMCTHMCPYSRFQSSMFDADTLTVTYDSSRGEGRGPRPRKMSQQVYQQQGLGDCVDCNLCVQVCPTGIDIRNGLQYECINCGACVDACNGVMDKMGYAKALIAYRSENAINGVATRLLRPKVIGYFSVLLIMCAALVVDISFRKSHDIDIIRDRTSLYRETFEGHIENVYTLIIRNKTQQSQSFTVTVRGLDLVEFKGPQAFEVPASELARFPVSLVVDPSTLGEAVTRFSIRVTDDNGVAISEQITFLQGP